jgi:anti-sigma regulatory factor (Ser/Thr protein kinase)
VIDLRLTNGPSATRAVRAAVDRVADERSLGEADRFDLKVAATEAVTNALRDAPVGEVVDVSVSADESSVDIEVAGRGRFSPQHSTFEYEMDAESGRGIPLMIALADEVEFTRAGPGTRVRIRKRF